MTTSIKSHSWLQTVALSLLPGLLILAFFVTAGPHLARRGIPSILAAFAAIPLVLIPFELGYLLNEAKKTREGCLKGVVLFRERMPIWQYVPFIAVLLIWSGLVFGPVSSRLDPYMADRYFHWLPGWFFTGRFLENIPEYSKSMLLFVW